MKKILVMFSIALLFIVVGCSPSEKDIEKAVERGDYQYIEKYLSTTKYWNDPSKSDTNAAAIEGLVLLNRIDIAVNLYRENKGNSLIEGMIVKAFADALAKSKPQKMPEKLIELIDDDRNDNSDALLRKTAVEIEPSMGIHKIKQYVEKAINERKTLAADTYKKSLNKALLWDVKGIFADVLNLVMQQYSELEKIAIKVSDAKNNLESKKVVIESLKELVKEKEQPVKKAQKNIQDLHSGNPYNLVVIGCLQMGKTMAFATSGRETPYSYCLKSLQEILKRETDALKEERKGLEEAVTEANKLKKYIVEYELHQKINIPNVEAAEAKALESLNNTIAE